MMPPPGPALARLAARRWQVPRLLAAEQSLEWEVGLGFVLSRALFALAALLAIWLLPENRYALVVHAPPAVSPAIDVFWRWDAVHYYTVAYDGYGGEVGKSAFFPLFPLAQRLGAIVLNGALAMPHYPIYQVPNYGLLLAGILLPNALFLFAAGLFYRLVRADHGRALARRATFYLALFPLSFFFIVPYTESLFLAATVGYFLCLRGQRWIWAGVFGLLAALTRQLGVLLILPLLWEFAGAWRRDRATARRDRGAVLIGGLLPLLGLGLFMLELSVRTGDPLAFVHAQADWDRTFTFPVSMIVEGLSYLLQAGANLSLTVGDLTGYSMGLVNTGLTLLFLVVALLSVRFWPGSFSVYVLISLVLILSNHQPPPYTFASMGRFVTVLFPVYLTMAWWGRRRAVNIAVLALAVVLFMICAALYVRWYFVA
jgi:Gpi18-like mannosyltransferase